MADSLRMPGMLSSSFSAGLGFFFCCLPLIDCGVIFSITLRLADCSSLSSEVALAADLGLDLRSLLFFFLAGRLWCNFSIALLFLLLRLLCWRETIYSTRLSSSGLM